MKINVKSKNLTLGSNNVFRKNEICGHLGLDPRSYACDMDMVDSAFERGDVGLFKPGIDYVTGGKFITLRRKLFAGF